MDVDIGGRLKRIRKANNLSQRTLAKRAGVSNATVSLMESGRLNPSIGNLKRVLDGVPISLADFFALDAPAADPAVFFPASELVEIGQPPISYRMVAAERPGKNLQILHERLAPGSDTGKIPLRHEGEEGGVVIRGKVELTVGDRSRVLMTGDAYYFESDLPHRFRNIGTEVCEIISACTPPNF